MWLEHYKHVKLSEPANSWADIFVVWCLPDLCQNSGVNAMAHCHCNEFQNAHTIRNTLQLSVSKQNLSNINWIRFVFGQWWWFLSIKTWTTRLVPRRRYQIINIIEKYWLFEGYINIYLTDVRTTYRRILYIETNNIIIIIYFYICTQIRGYILIYRQSPSTKSLVFHLATPPGIKKPPLNNWKVAKPATTHQPIGPPKSSVDTWRRQFYPFCASENVSF